MFGQPVTLNFNRQGDVFRTHCGATVSLAVNLFMIWFLIVKIDTLIGKSQNQINIESNPTDYAELGEVNFTDRNILPYIVIKRDGLPVSTPPDSEFFRHFSFEANVFSIERDSKRVRLRVPGRPCTLEDFNSVNQGKGFGRFLERYGQAFYCFDRQSFAALNTKFYGTFKET